MLKEAKLPDGWLERDVAAAREHTNRCRAASLRAGAISLRQRAENMLRQAAEYEALAERLAPVTG